jgi:hypothetical protein
MKLEVSFPGLEDLRQAMRASTSTWSLTSPEMEERRKFLEALDLGIEIDLADVKEGPRGLLTAGNQQILLYIKDSGQVLTDVLKEPSKKFHVAECEVLKDMRRHGRFDRYVATNRKTGFFRVDCRDEVGGSREVEAKLLVCMFCLEKLNWKGWKDLKWGARAALRNEFDLDDFFRSYSAHFDSTPSRTDLTAKVDAYTSDWPKISWDYRNNCGWICNRCRVNLSSFHKGLHVHHKSGVKTDNSPENLEALCACCHAEEPLHGHMVVQPEVREVISRLRKEQRSAFLK